MDKKYILSLIMVPFLVGGALTAEASTRNRASAYHHSHFNLFTLLSISAYTDAIHFAHGGFFQEPSLANSLLK
jgi:hypothetical protein